MSKIRNPHPKELDSHSTAFVGMSGRDRGLAVQELYDSSGIETNWGSGLDLPEAGEEIKTFTKGKHITIGSFNGYSVYYSDGEICWDKLHAHQWHEFDNKGVKRKSYYVNFNQVKDIILEDLSKLAQDLGDPKTNKFNRKYKKWTCAKSKFFMLEWTDPDSETSMQVSLRIPSNKVKKILTLTSLPTFNKLFKEA